MYLPVLGSHLTIWLPVSKQEVVISSTLEVSWYACKYTYTVHLLYRMTEANYNIVRLPSLPSVKAHMWPKGSEFWKIYSRVCSNQQLQIFSFCNLIITNNLPGNHQSIESQT
jgi:hypothetical protein